MPHGAADLAEVTSLKRAVRAWCALDAAHQAAAVLTPEHPLWLNEGEPVARFHGDAMQALADRLPGDAHG